MDVSRPRFLDRSRFRPSGSLLLGLGLLLAPGSTMTLASPIRHVDHHNHQHVTAAQVHDNVVAAHNLTSVNHKVTAQQVALNHVESFLVGGPAVWETSHAPIFPKTWLHNTLRAEVTNGVLPDNALVHYLYYRQSLNKVRFNHFHPCIAKMMAENTALRAKLAQPPVVTGTPPVTITQLPPGQTAPQTIFPDGPKVPEPSTVLIGAVLIGAFAWWRRPETGPAESPGLG